MYEGWSHTGFAYASAVSLSGSEATAELLPNGSVGAGGFARTVFKLAYITVDLSSIANAPAEVEVSLTWDAGGDHFITDAPLVGTIQIGKTTATDGTAVINVPNAYNLAHPPKGLYTNATTDKADKIIKVWARVKLNGGTSPTATANIRAGFYHGGI